MPKNFHKNKYNFGSVRQQDGVTLVELVVVIIIFVIVSGIAMFNYSKFRSSLSIQNLADDIALSVRRAQSYAIGVLGTSGGFALGYGIHFTANPNQEAYRGSNKSFVLFANIGDNFQYDNSSNICGKPKLGNECLESLQITTADNIESIFLNNEINPIAKEDTLDIIFKRPNPEPTFCYRVGGTGKCNSSGISNVRIRVSTDTDSSIYKIISIYNNGQVSVSGGI